MEMLQDKNVLIVGATGGIGKETARLIKQHKANVFLSGRDRDKLEELSSELKIDAENCFLLDITDGNEVQKVADTIHQRIEKLDILINTAGIGVIKSMDNLSSDDFARTLDVNLKGAFHLMKSFLPPMKEEKQGLIINIPGVLGKAPMAGAAAYTASKYGLDGMTKSIREELKRTNVRITNLYLGGVDSPFWDEIDMRVNRDKMITAKEAAKAVWFLCQQPDSGVVSEMVLQPFNHQVL